MKSRINAPWFRMLGTFAIHPDIEQLRDATFRVHVRALCLCSLHATDGLVKRSDLKALRATPKRLGELVDSGLWVDVGDGVWQMKNWSLYQETSDDLKRERARKAKNTRNFRAKNDQLLTKKSPTFDQLLTKKSPTFDQLLTKKSPTFDQKTSELTAENQGKTGNVTGYPRARARTETETDTETDTSLGSISQTNGIEETQKAAAPVYHAQDAFPAVDDTARILAAMVAAKRRLTTEAWQPSNTARWSQAAKRIHDEYVDVDEIVAACEWLNRDRFPQTIRPFAGQPEAWPKAFGSLLAESRNEYAKQGIPSKNETSAASFDQVRRTQTGRRPKQIGPGE